MPADLLSPVYSFAYVLEPRANRNCWLCWSNKPDPRLRSRTRYRFDKERFTHAHCTFQNLYGSWALILGSR